MHNYGNFNIINILNDNDQSESSTRNQVYRHEKHTHSCITNY